MKSHGVIVSLGAPYGAVCAMSEVVWYKLFAGKLLETIIVGLTIVLVIIFALSVDGFATIGNLGIIVSNSASLVILSSGMSVVIISRGLDLSMIAAMIAGATTFCILILAGVPTVFAILLTMVAMAGIGLINAWLIAYVEIPAILATLASAMFIAGFFRFMILRGEFLLLLPTTDPLVILLSSDILPGVSTQFFLMVATLAATWFLLRSTSTGHIIYAIGDNFQTARLSGLPVRTTLIAVYVFAAMTALIAGLLTSSASGTVDFRTVSNGTLLFDVILVVVLGGIPLRGGRGGVSNILIGVALIAVLKNGMTLLDFTTQTQDALKGVVLLSAIITDSFLNPRDTETDTVGDL